MLRRLPADQVALGDDTQYPVLFVEDRQSTDVVLSEQLGDILERGGGDDRDDFVGHQVSDLDVLHEAPPVVPVIRTDVKAGGRLRTHDLPTPTRGGGPNGPEPGPIGPAPTHAGASFLHEPGPLVPFGDLSGPLAAGVRCASVRAGPLAAL